MLVLRGDVQFFTVDGTVADGTNLAYKLTLLSTAGETYLLKGYKEIDSSVAFSIPGTWKATKTLHTTITRIDGSMVGRGVLHVSWRNFESEVESFGTTTSGSLLQKVIPSLRFLSYFARNVLSFFLAPLSRLDYPDPAHTGYLLKAAPAQVVTLTARDGVQTPLKVWVPPRHSAQSNGVKTKKLPLLLIPGASVDDGIYSLPTIPENTVDYFTSHGYTVYIPTPRFGRIPAAHLGNTAYDARLDVEAAMKYVHDRHPGKMLVHDRHPGKMLVVCHCVGAIATSMGLLDGTLPAEWIQGLVASQVFFKQHFGRVNAIKARTPLLANVYRFLAGPWFPMVSMPKGPSLVQFLIDQVLRLYPVGPTAELCTSTVCHRCSLIFGRLWNHDNLTHATHAHLVNFFGGIHMDMLTNLMRTGTAGHDLDNAGNNLLTDTNVARLQGIPMMFLSGGDNVVFDPISTSMCYDFMRERFGTALYRRVVVGGYGHLDTWMGKRSRYDVYPKVRENLEWFESLEGQTPGTV
ncbi:glucose-methanol-choline oxidoreductase [Mycena galericulata]|nr:glucose-methanol-choline oxidoreductase [Mycena galericulata]